MRQYVLTRSAYGPAWPRDANARRLAITERITAAMMAAQTVQNWSWVVLLDDRDPLLVARMRVFVAAAPMFIPILWHSEETDRNRAAAADYHAPWRSYLGNADDTILMTRLDDDDGFMPDALARYQAAAEGLTERTALVLPVGIHRWRGDTLVRHETNAMHTLVTPPGDTLCVYDYGHMNVRQVAPTIMVDEDPGWLWFRHRDTISGARDPRRWAA